MNWVHKYRKHVLLSIVGIFLIGTFASFGDYVFHRSPLDVAITVEDQKIPRKRFDKLYQQVLMERQNSGTPPTAPEQEWMKRQVVQALVQEAVFIREAEAYGVTVSDMELAQYIQSIPAFQTEGKFDPVTYQRALAQARYTVPQFETDQRRQLRTQKTQYLMASGVHVSSLEVPGKIQARLARIDQVLKAGPAGLEKFPEENPNRQPPAEVMKGLTAERDGMMKNPASFRDQVRNQEIRASLQEWYTAINTQLKIKIQLDPPAAS